MIAIFLALISAVAAQVGGFLALNKRSRLGITLGFTAGALIGLVAFGLLPEIFELAEEQELDFAWPMAALVAGFLGFHTIEKFILIHHSHEKQYAVHKHPHVGVASGLALAGHSLLDGVSIGLAFQVDESVGVAVAIAVIGHRFVDGFNGVNLILQNKGSRNLALKVLAIVAVAPVLGVLATFLFALPETLLAIYLGFFAGFLIYIGASDILPQAHSKGSSRVIIAMTVLGAVVMYCITRLAHGGHTH